MDTKQIEYILKIAEENNITHAANKLFLTQSALNQQLIKLEQELGTPLFHRSRSNWHLTQAGEIYVKNAREMLRLKRETYQMIHDLDGGKCGRLSVGFTAGRGINMFTKVYGAFHQLYPHVVIEPVEGIVRELQKKIAMGDLDLAFLTLTDRDRTDDVYEPIYREELFLVIPSSHPLASKAEDPKEGYAVMDLKEAAGESFVLMDQRSTMSTLLSHIFAEAGFTPRVLFETGNNHTILSMIRARLCCGILPYYYVKDLDQDFCAFALPSHPTWQFAGSYKKGRYLSRPARSFLDLMKEQWGDETAAEETASSPNP